MVVLVEGDSGGACAAIDMLCPEPERDSFGGGGCGELPEAGSAAPWALSESRAESTFSAC